MTKLIAEADAEMILVKVTAVVMTKEVANKEVTMAEVKVVGKTRATDTEEMMTDRVTADLVIVTEVGMKEEATILGMMIVRKMMNTAKMTVQDEKRMVVV